MLTHEPTKENITEVYERIKPYIHKTPVVSSRLINEITGSEIYFKCENLQKAGAFKFRGATNAILSLPKEKTAKGVATHSSGNHAGALAKAAKMNGIPAYIVMPENAPEIKKQAVKDYGAEITFCHSTQKDREETLEKVIEKTGAHFIHPYNNYDIIAGQATSAYELIEEKPDLDIIMAPIGGGGLMSGTLLSAYYFGEGITRYGAEPAGADDAFRSIRDNRIYPSINPDTVADGLRTSLAEKTFGIIKKYVNEIFTVSEDSIIEAMRLIWTRTKVIVEASSAVPLAAVLENPEKFAGKKTGIIISGGNADPDNLPW